MPQFVSKFTFLRVRVNAQFRSTSSVTSLVPNTSAKPLQWPFMCLCVPIQSCCLQGFVFEKSDNIAELQLRLLVNAPSSAAHSWVPFAHMGDDHHCFTENSLPAERNVRVARPSCTSCAERKWKNEFRVPSHRFSLNFCFGLHSPSEIRALLSLAAWLGVLFVGWFCVVVPCSDAWLVPPWCPYLIQSR